MTKEEIFITNMKVHYSMRPILSDLITTMLSTTYKVMLQIMTNKTEKHIPLALRYLHLKKMKI